MRRKKKQGIQLERTAQKILLAYPTLSPTLPMPIVDCKLNRIIIHLINKPSLQDSDNHWTQVVKLMDTRVVFGPLKGEQRQMGLVAVASLFHHVSHHRLLPFLDVSVK